MAFTDVTDGTRTIVEGNSPFKITLGGTVAVGDPIALSGGSGVQADGNNTLYAEFIAGETGDSGDIIVCYRSAKIGGITTGTVGARVYLSDDAGGYSVSAGTVRQDLGFEIGNGQIWAEPAWVITTGLNSTASVDVTITNPGASNEGIDSEMAISGTTNYAGTSLKCIKGNIEFGTTGGYTGNAYGGWFGVKLNSTGDMERGGLVTGLYAEAHTQRTENCQPSSVAYFQSVLSGNGIMANSPILVLTSTGGNNTTKSKYAFSFGYAPSSTTVSTVDGATTAMFRTGGNATTNITLKQGLLCLVNGAEYYIPLMAVADWNDD